MTSYPHLQMIKTRYKYAEEPAQSCVDKSIYFRTEADASGQRFDNLLRTRFGLPPGNTAPLLSICTSWKVSGPLSCWLSRDLFSPCFAPTAHCTRCSLLPSCRVPETWDSIQPSAPHLSHSLLKSCQALLPEDSSPIFTQAFISSCLGS